MNGKSPAQRIGRTVAGDWVSRGYLMVIAALLVWVWVDTTLVSHPDASFAGVYPILLTAPGSLLLLLPGIEASGLGRAGGGGPGQLDCHQPDRPPGGRARQQPPCRAGRHPGPVTYRPGMYPSVR